MLSNQKSSRSNRIKAAAFCVIALALLMNVTAFASGNSRFAFIDTAAEFFGLQSNNAVTTTQVKVNNNAFVDVAVSLPVVVATPGTISVPITVGDLTGLGVISFDCNIDYDPAVLTPAAISTTSTGTLVAGWSITPNTSNAGHFIISAFNGTATAGSGTLLFVNFNVIGAPGTMSPLAFADYTDPGPAFHTLFTFNEGDPVPNPITAGSVSVPLGPTATSTNTNTPTPSATSTFTPSNTATNTSTPTPSNTATNTSTPTPTPACAQVDIDDKVVSSGDPVTLSVMTSDTTVLSPPAFSADMHISYDTTVLSLQTGPSYGVTLGSVGLSNSSSLTVNQVVSGSTATIFISVFGQTPFTGSGSLVDISWATVTGAPGTFSPVTFTAFPLVPMGFVYNEGFPTSCVNDGSVSITGTVSGRVIYGNILAAPATRPVPNTTITGNGVPVVSDVTDTGGFYNIGGFGMGNYTMVPSRPSSALPDTHGSSITAYDAAITAQHVVQLIVLNPTQKGVANVSGVQPISSFDSAFMAKWAVSLPGTALTGNWVFSPTNILHLFVGSIVNEDYLGLLMGDVSGNWCDPTSGVVPCNITGTNGGPRPARGVSGPTRATEVVAKNVAAPAGSDVVVPVNVTGTADKGIISYQFDLRYDAKVLQPQAEAVTLGGTVSSEMSVVFNPIAPGVLRVAVYGPYALTDNGTMLNFHFTAIGAPFSTSPIHWDNFMFNEGGIRTSVVDGQVAITAAVPTTAAE